MKKKEVRLAPSVFEAAGLLEPWYEHKIRKGTDKRGRPTYWRFDYAWPSEKLFLEVQGGIWLGRHGKHAGRHSGGTGQIRDMQKYNVAAIMGWRIIYATPEEVKSLAVLGIVRAALQEKGGG